MLKDTIVAWDSRRDIVIAKDFASFAAEHWIHTAKRAIQQRGFFAVALSGGSTPQIIYKEVVKADLDWSKIWLFWSDERAVAPNQADSNFAMAMSSGFDKLPIPAAQIIRMVAEKEIEKGARDYEDKIRHYLGTDLFDLVMLGIGDDGHTASLFPGTEALEITDRWVVPNFIPQKETWRMTLTFPCIEQSKHTAIFVAGASKQTIVPQILEAAIISPYPASRVGTEQHKALWVLDENAATLLK